MEHISMQWLHKYRTVSEWARRRRAEAKVMSHFWRESSERFFSSRSDVSEGKTCVVLTWIGWLKKRGNDCAEIHWQSNCYKSGSITESESSSLPAGWLSPSQNLSSKMTSKRIKRNHIFIRHAIHCVTGDGDDYRWGLIGRAPSKGCCNDSPWLFIIIRLAYCLCVDGLFRHHISLIRNAYDSWAWSFVRCLSGQYFHVMWCLNYFRRTRAPLIASTNVFSCFVFASIQWLWPFEKQMHSPRL